MKFIKPNFYDAFHCTAAACSDTCCAGWEIDVDPDTVEYYENLEGELGDRLREELCDLPDGTVCFRLGENERCPFLDDDNLCSSVKTFRSLFCSSFFPCCWAFPSSRCLF